MSKKEIKLKISRYLPNASFQKKIKKVALFGSYLRGEERKDSDIDLLVEFNGIVTFFDLFDMEEALSEVLGKRVEMMTESSLSPFFRKEVTQSAETIYEK